MAGLLSGLDKLGLANLEKMDLYEETASAEKAGSKQVEIQKPEINEEDLLFDKTYECPVCYSTFKARTIRTGKAKLIRTDMDLRPVYEHIEPLKYDVILCPHCGYAVLTRFFQALTSSQVKAVRETVSQSYQGEENTKAVYSYEEAISYYKLCLANTIVKHGKTSEKAYICLKTGWLVRSMAENMDPSIPNYEQKQQDAKVQEKEFLKNALDGFITARQSEGYPMCGMDELTVEYLIAVLAMEFEQYEVSAKLISNIIVSPSANNRIKDKARDVKEALLTRIRDKNAN